MIESRVHPYLMLLIGVAAVSSAAVLIRLADAPPLAIGAWRLLLAGVPAAVFALLPSQRRPAPPPRRIVALCLTSGVLLALHFAFWISSLQYTSVMKSVVLVTTQPVFVALGAALLLHEPLTARVVAGILLAMAGAAAMASAGGAHEDHAVAGYALAILGAACAAGYFLIGRHLRIGLPLSRYVGIVYPMAGVMLAALALVSQQPLAGFEPRTYLMLGLLALVPQLIGHSALNWSLRYLPAAVVTVAVLGEPVGATALAAIVLGEVPTLQEASGAGIVLVGVWVALTGGRSGQASRVAVAEDAHPCPAPHHSRRHLFRRRF